ncbi:DUF2889 domain-containing protein [Motiliproteus sediminis]|uniref:DUF2889 domain-containing protein n=1 Tax=Motiliproteus sediminis TaxID=1468178 RepID=UPI001AEFECD1|nr:DUF2889 domain-containing protein [Motiliproteus sediminis]
MPLSTPAPRALIHKRRVSCDGFERNDGLWDIEGHMTDVKTYDMENRDRGGIIPTGEPLHGMSIRLTIDLDFLVHDVEAVIDYSPFNYCPGIVDQFKQLIGHRIEPGWTQLTRRLFGGVKGCTHLQELLGPMATTAFQATHLARKQRQVETASGERPALINTCHALGESSPVVRDFWPDFYQPPGNDGDER